MRIALVTREYPPEVYGGAGGHVEYAMTRWDPFAELGSLFDGPDRVLGRRR